MAYILSIDQSTSGTKGLIFKEDGTLISRADLEHKQITNDKGWVEHDPVEIYQNTLAVARLVLEKAKLLPEQISAVGISNQRETAVCWDSITGEPVYNAIVWQCARAVDITAEIEEKGLAGKVRDITGLSLSPYFSAAKFSWIIRNIQLAAQKLSENRLCCGNIDAWLIYNLTNKKSFKTDYSNASRTQLLNLDTLNWDDELLKEFSLTKKAMPKICFSDSNFGETTFNGLFQKPISIHGVLGDSHAALFGNDCTVPFTAKATYGTGSSVMMNVGSQRPKAVEGTVTSLAWGMNGEVNYVLEGNINYAGAVTKWLVDDVELIENSKQAGEISETIDNTNGVYLVPAFSGLGAPYFKNGARAILCGMNRTTKRAHIVRAAEECIVYQIADVFNAINSGTNSPLKSLRVDGGPTHDKFLMQFQADILDVDIEISSTEELSGAGAAYCTAISSGLITKEELFENRRCEIVSPKMSSDTKNKLYSGWLDSVALIGNK